MKISIITPCLNREETITDTINSVINQYYEDFEYIIIDGGSTDSTLNIIKKFTNKIGKIISEPDKGVYDAMNKGISQSSGEIIGIINSDDFYLNSNVLKKVANIFEHNKEIKICYGDIFYINRNNTEKITRKWRAGEFNKKKLHWGWVPPHPAVFVRKELYNKFGNFNLDFKIAADYELLLRFFSNLEEKQVYYLNEYLVKMREGGSSASSLRQRCRGWREIRQAWFVNNKMDPHFLIIKRVLSKLFQFL